MSCLSSVDDVLGKEKAPAPKRVLSSFRVPRGKNRLQFAILHTPLCRLAVFALVVA